MLYKRVKKYICNLKEEINDMNLNLKIKKRTSQMESIIYKCLLYILSIMLYKIDVFKIYKQILLHACATTTKKLYVYINVYIIKLDCIIINFML